MSSDSDVVRVSLKRGYTFFVYQSKEILKDKGTVELHGLGEAVANVVRAAEMLCSLGYAQLEKFDTQSVSEPDREGVSRNRNKVVIILSKAASFDQAYDDFEKTRQTKK